MLKLHKIISGGQVGVDRAGLEAARDHKIETGGYVPKGFMTLRGPDLTLKQFGVTEMSTSDYKRRTWKNVEMSDGTIRLANNFKSAGEICTKNAVLAFSKPCFDVDLLAGAVSTPTVFKQADDFIKWLDDNNIGVLNVAGNSDGTSGDQAYEFLCGVLITIDNMLNSSHSDG